MFYSQLLLSKKGALGIVWMAAHCHKKLKKEQVQQTDISSSVDKILDDEVNEVAHRILAFLLLGIVRIYSKKVDYLFHDCHHLMNKLHGYKKGKGTSLVLGGSESHYRSISLPKRFELDAFDLELALDQDLVIGNVLSHKQLTLAGGLQKDENIPQFSMALVEAYSSEYTPDKNVINTNMSSASKEIVCGTSYCLEDRLDPMDLDESDIRSHSIPSLEMLRETRFSLEDCLEPMVLDECEKELIDGPSRDIVIVTTHSWSPIRDVELLNDSVDETQSKKMKLLTVRTCEEEPEAVTPKLNLPAGDGTKEVAILRTPALKEARRKISKKRNILMIDSNTKVPAAEFKRWMTDPSDLKRERKTIPHSRLDAWRDEKLRDIPQSLFDAFASCVFINPVACEIETTPAAKMKPVELSNGQDDGMYDQQILDVRSPEQTAIAPSTPISRLNSLTLVADSANSPDIVEKSVPSCEELELDDVNREETDSFDGDIMENDGYSTRTRLTEKYLGNKFSEKKRHNEEEILNLSYLLTRKTKRESARLFYDILVLKTKNSIDVQQETAYDDIFLKETSKLKIKLSMK